MDDGGMILNCQVPPLLSPVSIQYPNATLHPSLEPTVPPHIGKIPTSPCCNERFSCTQTHRHTHTDHTPPLPPCGGRQHDPAHALCYAPALRRCFSLLCFVLSQRGKLHDFAVGMSFWCWFTIRFTATGIAIGRNGRMMERRTLMYINRGVLAVCVCWSPAEGDTIRLRLH